MAKKKKKKKDRLGGSSQPRNPMGHDYNARRSIALGQEPRTRPLPWEKPQWGGTRNPLNDTRPGVLADQRPGGGPPRTTGPRDRYVDPDTGEVTQLRPGMAAKAYWLARMSPEERAEYDAYMAELDAEYGKYGPGSKPRGKWKESPDDAGVRRAPPGIAKQPKAKRKIKGTSLYLGKDPKGEEKREDLQAKQRKAFAKQVEYEALYNKMSPVEKATELDAYQEIKKANQDAVKALKKFEDSYTETYGGALTKREREGKDKRRYKGRDWKWQNGRWAAGAKRRGLTDDGRTARKKRLAKDRQKKIDAGLWPGDYIHVSPNLPVGPHLDQWPSEMPLNERLRRLVEGRSAEEGERPFTGETTGTWTEGGEGSPVEGLGPGVLITRKDRIPGTRETRSGGPDLRPIEDQYKDATKNIPPPIELPPTPPPPPVSWPEFPTDPTRLEEGDPSNGVPYDPSLHWEFDENGNLVPRSNQRRGTPPSGPQSPPGGQGGPGGPEGPLGGRGYDPERYDPNMDPDMWEFDQWLAELEGREAMTGGPGGPGNSLQSRIGQGGLGGGGGPFPPQFGGLSRDEIERRGKRSGHPYFLPPGHSPGVFKMPGRAPWNPRSPSYPPSDPFGGGQPDPNEVAPWNPRSPSYPPPSPFGGGPDWNQPSRPELPPKSPLERWGPDAFEEGWGPQPPNEGRYRYWSPYMGGNHY